MVEKISKKQIRMKNILMFIIFTLFTSCTTHQIYFDIGSQQLISCNSSTFSSLSIDGYDNSVSLFWQDTINIAPHKLDLNNIPNRYKETTGGVKRVKPFKLLPNSQYTISKDGMGRNPHYIRIWTNAIGNVYKTTHPNCNCGDGDDGVSEDWIM